MRKQYLWIHHFLKVVAILCLCLVLAVIVISASTTSTAGATANGPLPQIKSFTAEPLTLKDNESAIYKFEVLGATNLELIEAGSLLKLISGPPDATIKGSVRGMTPNQFRTGDSNEFNSILRVSNGNGTVDKMLTLSYVIVRQPKLELPAGQTGAVENQTESRAPKWLAQFSSPVSLTSSTASIVSPWPPPFAKCPSGCDKCLRPEEAAALGSNQKCLEQPCYYSPDKQQNWYCYKPGTGWCCSNGKYSPASKEQCGKVGGNWYATEAEVIKACQPATGWFCTGGKVFQGTSAQAAQAGAYLYTTEAEATKACQQQGYCCQNGRLTSATLSTCKDAGGTFYTDPNQAGQACQQQGYCCINGQLSTTTATACKYAGGTFYTDQTQARACYLQATCWCCSGGKVFQATQSSCSNSGGKCYSTQSQATAACSYRLKTDTVLPFVPIQPTQPQTIK